MINRKTEEMKLVRRNNSSILIAGVLVTLFLSFMGCQSSNTHAIYDPRTGFRFDLPTGWNRLSDEKLQTPQNEKAGLIGVATDPEKKAVVAVRRFTLNWMPLGLSLPVTYNNLNTLQTDAREAMFTGLLKKFESYLSEGNEYWQLLSSNHGGPSSRAYSMEITGLSRSPGQPLEWGEYIVLLPKGNEEAIEVRFTASSSDKEKYQSDFALMDGNLKRWMDGAE